MENILLEKEKKIGDPSFLGERRKPGAHVDVQTPNQTALHPLTPSQE